MKKILIVAALLATVVGPASIASAATTAPAAAMPKPICYILPLTKDCMASWKAADDAWMAKWKTTTTKVAVAVPKVTMPKMTMPKMSMPMMLTCAKAAAGAGHLYDCKM